MTAFFGTVEYFEREFRSFAAKRNLSRLTNDQILMAYFRFKKELLNNFVCDERVRLECFQNLERACFKIKSVELCVSAE